MKQARWGGTTIALITLASLIVGVQWVGERSLQGREARVEYELRVMAEDIDAAQWETYKQQERARIAEWSLAEMTRVAMGWRGMAETGKD